MESRIESGMGTGMLEFGFRGWIGILEISEAVIQTGTTLWDIMRS